MLPGCGHFLYPMPRFAPIILTTDCAYPGLIALQCALHSTLQCNVRYVVPLHYLSLYNAISLALSLHIALPTCNALFLYWADARYMSHYKGKASYICQL